MVGEMGSRLRHGNEAVVLGWATAQNISETSPLPVMCSLSWHWLK